MKLSAENTLQKIKDEDLSFWKLYVIDRYIKDRRNSFSSFDSKDTEASVNALAKQIELATKEEDCEFYIEARKDASSNQSGIKSWYFVGYASRKPAPGDKVNTDYAGGLGMLERPFVQNYLSGLERKEADLKTYERELSAKRDQIVEDRMKITIQENDLKRDKEAFAADKKKQEDELKELKKKYESDVEAAMEGVKLGIKNFIHTNIKDDTKALAGTEAEATPEEKLIESIAENIFNQNLSIEQIKKVGVKVQLFLDELKNEN
jgi:hypothetical protein